MSGGLALLWQNREEGTVQGYSQYHIDLLVEVEGNRKWRLIGFYGEPRREHRQVSWDLLRTLAHNNSELWCVIGDVNNILSQSEKRGGNRYPEWLLEGFQRTLTYCNLVDVDLLGYQYTWEKGKGTKSWIEVRLDRALVSTNWYESYPDTRLTNLELTSSDHCPSFFEPVVQTSGVFLRRFRFENAWLKDPLCYEIVKDCWNADEGGSIFTKLNLCATKLASWGKEITENFTKRIRWCKGEMKKLKQRRDAGSVQQFGELKNRLFTILEQKEAFWKQRAKQFWLQEGDQNSKYFHRAATKRKNNNQITSLKNSSGVWVDWEGGLEDVVVEYFNNLFSEADTSNEEVINCVKSCVNQQMNITLLQPVVEEEVKRAVFDMHPDKSPGPDGMTPMFYQKCWGIVHKDVVKIVQTFFHSGEFQEGCSEANVVLIPKKKNIMNMGDLRPIALCNVLYKIVTKVMANRMKPIMDKIVAPTQSAFIPGRLITDNILVSFEVLHYLKRKRKGKEGYMALKLDMSKAYDRI